MRKLKTIFLSLVLICSPYFGASCIDFKPEKSPLVKVSSDIASAWGYASITAIPTDNFKVLTSGGAEGGMPYLCGPNGDVCPSDHSEYPANEWGTFGRDQGALVALIARKIKTTGALICATQVQAAYHKKNIWLDFYEVNSSACRWFCKQGYYGDGCTKEYDELEEIPADDTDYTVYVGYAKQFEQGGISFFGNLDEQRRRSGGNSNKIGIEVFNYRDFYNLTPSRTEKPAVYTLSVLASWGHEVSQEFPHGLMVGVVRWGDATWGRKQSSDKIIKTQLWPGDLVSKPILLCASGYRIDKNNQYNCVKYVMSEEDKKIKNLCSGFSRESYKGSAVMELYESNGCYKYRCIGNNIGFRSAGDKTCISCPPRSGVLTSGECSVPCSEIQHFDNEKQECVTNTTYTHAELKYGKGNVVSRGFAQDCWPLWNEEEYRNCVINGGR